MTNQPNTEAPAPKKRGPKPGGKSNNPNGRPPKLEHPRIVPVHGRVSQEVYDILQTYGRKKSDGERIEAAIRDLMTLR